MKKREKKMQIHRETVIRLTGRELAPAQLVNARGAVDDTGRWTSCGSPNCCGETIDTQ
jgi:hypothetical protein